MRGRRGMREIGAVIDRAYRKAKNLSRMGSRRHITGHTK